MKNWLKATLSILVLLLFSVPAFFGVRYFLGHDDLGKFTVAAVEPADEPEPDPTPKPSPTPRPTPEPTPEQVFDESYHSLVDQAPLVYKFVESSNQIIDDFAEYHDLFDECPRINDVLLSSDNTATYRIDDNNTLTVYSTENNEYVTQLSYIYKWPESESELKITEVYLDFITGSVIHFDGNYELADSILKVTDWKSNNIPEGWYFSEAGGIHVFSPRAGYVEVDVTFIYPWRTVSFSPGKS